MPSLNDPIPPISRSATYVQTIRYFPSATPTSSYKSTETSHPSPQHYPSSAAMPTYKRSDTFHPPLRLLRTNALIPPILRHNITPLRLRFLRINGLNFSIRCANRIRSLPDSLRAALYHLWTYVVAALSVPSGSSVLCYESSRSVWRKFKRYCFGSTCYSL